MVAFPELMNNHAKLVSLASLDRDRRRQAKSSNQHYFEAVALLELRWMAQQ